MGWLDKLKQGMKKTAARLSGANVADLDSIEEALILSDVGVKMALELTNLLRKEKPEKIKENTADNTLP